jgi:hypothetical protein
VQETREAKLGIEYIYIPGKGAVLHSFLTVLSPSVPIFQMINLALCHKRKSRLSLSLLVCLLGFQPKHHKHQNQILKTTHFKTTYPFYGFSIIMIFFFNIKTQKKKKKKKPTKHKAQKSHFLSHHVLKWVSSKHKIKSQKSKKTQNKKLTVF